MKAEFSSQPFFLCEYLYDEEPRCEIHEGRNVITVASTRASRSMVSIA